MYNFHKDKETLDLLGNYAHKKSEPNEEIREKIIIREQPIIREKIVYRTTGQFTTKKKEVKEKEEIFKIPNFIWYSITLFFCIYIARELFLINQMNKAFEAGTEMNKIIINESQKTINMIRGLEKPNFPK